MPALGVGWILDDYYHRSVLLPNSPFRELLGTPAEMFRFFRGDPVRTHRIMDIGVFPWWTDPILKAEFLQALTVFTHRLDYALWPDSPALMHAQSLFWLGASLAAVAVFYRRMLGPTAVAATAALLYAIDDARGPTVGFIANRNVLIAATFGVSALIFHDRWRRVRLVVGGDCWPRSCSLALCSPRKKASALVRTWRPTVFLPTGLVAGEGAWRCGRMSASLSSGGRFAITGATEWRTWASMWTR